MKSRCCHNPKSHRDPPSPRRLSVIAVKCILVCIPLGLNLHLLGQTPSSSVQAQSGILLLRNGQILGGNYLTTGFGYEVSLKGGGIIRLRKDQIEFISDSIDEIYAFRRASKVNNSGPAHLEMAGWCLNNHLFNYAKLHLEQAIRINPREPGLIAIQARLAIASRPQPKSSGGMIVDLQELDSNDVIEEEIERLNPAVIKSFVNHVQPLLLNKCALAGCHGPHPRSTFQLIESRWTKTIPRGISYRNLFNTLNRLEPKPPNNDHLVTKALTAHGGLKIAKLTVGDKLAVERLVNWAKLATQTSPKADSTAPDAFRHSPIIFKAGNIPTNSHLQSQRVPIPGPPAEIRIGGTEDESLTGSELMLRSPMLTETTLSKKILKQADFKDVPLSNDFQDLPLDPLSNRLLKVFLPPTPSRTTLTPDFNARYVLPSDFLKNAYRTKTDAGMD